MPNDPESLWRGQPAGGEPGSIDMFKRRAERLRQRSRVLVARSGLSALALVVFCLWAIAYFQMPLQRAGFGLAAIWTVLGFLHTWRSIERGKEPAAISSVEHCRREIRRQMAWNSAVLSWYPGPVLLAIAAFALPVVEAIAAAPHLAVRVVPFSSLVVLWVVGLFVVRWYRLREYRRDLEELP